MFSTSPRFSTSPSDDAALGETALYEPGVREFVSLTLRQTAAATRPLFLKDTMPSSAALSRFMIWVDSVGGYLVCTDDEVVLGHPAKDSVIALPIRADLARRHAILRREAGTYTIEPLGKVSIDGRPLTGPTVLGGEQEIQLGDTVRIKFTMPHALSATARLLLTSPHRTEPRADAVLLMADSCVLGPKSHCHIECRGWGGDVVLFRKGEGLAVRASEPISIDGVEVVEVAGPADLPLGSRLEGESFALSLEQV